MTVAHDVYSETNPAFCAFLLAAFVDAYAVTKGCGPDLVTAYVALPIALSGDLGPSFGGTNKKTGLAMWLQRRPEVQIGLSDRVNKTLAIVTEAVRFSTFVEVLTVEADGRLKIGPATLKASAAKALTDQSGQALKRAERLGYWFADVGSTRTVFDTLGLTV
jgi:hypothetical protein